MAPSARSLVLATLEGLYLALNARRRRRRRWEPWVSLACCGSRRRPQGADSYLRHASSILQGK